MLTDDDGNDDGDGDGDDDDDDDGDDDDDDDDDDVHSYLKVLHAEEVSWVLLFDRLLEVGQRCEWRSAAEGEAGYSLIVKPEPVNSVPTGGQRWSNCHGPSCMDTSGQRRSSLRFVQLHKSHRATYTTPLSAGLIAYLVPTDPKHTHPHKPCNQHEVPVPPTPPPPPRRLPAPPLPHHAHRCPVLCRKPVKTPQEQVAGPWGGGGQQMLGDAV